MRELIALVALVALTACGFTARPLSDEDSAFWKAAKVGSWK